MIPERAIEKAIEGGWTGLTLEQLRFSNFISDDVYREMAFDPTFWRGVGKAKGWPSDDPGEPIPADMLLDEWKRTRPWGRAMRFYHLVYNGGDLRAYWDELLG